MLHLLGIQCSFLLVSSYLFCRYLSLVCFHLFNLLFDSLIDMSIYSLCPLVPNYVRLLHVDLVHQCEQVKEGDWECSLGILQVLQRWHKRPASMGDSRGVVGTSGVGGGKLRPWLLGMRSRTFFF